MDARTPERPSSSEAESDTRASEEPWVRCADCSAEIAPVAAAISVNGAHLHEFVNPSAITFVVRCFAQAPGAVGVGERSTTWTWFPGFAWEIELCRRCAAHVGWSFHGVSVFYGLIRDRLV
ncbi:MAG: hypothetical protein KIT84_04190 [Labilithrix sp.]|nr:hypothetical protein [Labilithrix sp.]MCW5810186.1 hypothetical protein [Labilithrix sp.]